MRYANSVVERYNPLYFLSALGAGGISISFFMYLMWMTPHKGQPIPSFSTLLIDFTAGSVLTQIMIGASVIGVAFFALLHLRILYWNFVQLNIWKKTTAYKSLKSGNAENQLMTIPLSLAMSVNVLFIVGAVFVPGLWSIAEYLFPFAMLAFALIGAQALSIFGDFISRVLTKGGFDCAKNNSFGQMLSVFSLAMVGVGFSASAAMTHNKLVSAIGFFGSTFFIAASIILGAIFMVIGFRSMMENVAEKETSPTLWIIIPFITVAGIAVFRLNMALDHNFGVEWTSGEIFAFLIALFSVQLLFGLLGYAVMKRFGYFDHFIKGDAKSAGSYALICPGVALFVFANFVINPGLVGIGIVEKFSIAYFVMYIPLVYLQFITIKTFFRLNAKMLRADNSINQPMVPAE